jgi:SAM-dependent methyltransferase
LKKYFYLFLSNLSLFIIFPIIRLISKSFYEKNILPNLINLTCNSGPINYQRKKIIPNAKGNVLEIGIGPGSNLKHYDNTKVSSILGIDPSKELNQIAKNRAEKYNLNIEFLIESASNLSVDNNSIDTVVSTYALCSIPEPEKTLQEIKRVLKMMEFLFLVNMVCHQIRMFRLFKMLQILFILKLLAVVIPIEILKN